MNKSIDDDIEQILKDENASSQAIKSLITVKDRESGKDSEVELKTDLSEDDIKIHTVLAVLSNIIEMKQKSFSKSCILASVIEKKERKALSKDRKSRGEIVAVARQPDMTFPMEMAGRENFVKRMFTPRRPPV